MLFKEMKRGILMLGAFPNMFKNSLERLQGDGMLKGVGILIGGIFVGEVGVEVIRKKYPDALDKLCTRTREIASEAKEAFKKGYENAVRSREAAQPSA